MHAKDTDLPAISGCLIEEVVHARFCRFAFGSKDSHAKGVLSDDESIVEELPRSIRRWVQFEGTQLPRSTDEQVGKSVEVVMVSREPGEDNGLETGHVEAFEAVQRFVHRHLNGVKGQVNRHLEILDGGDVSDQVLDERDDIEGEAGE